MFSLDSVIKMSKLYSRLNVKVIKSDIEKNFLTLARSCWIGCGSLSPTEKIFGKQNETIEISESIFLRWRTDA